MMPAVRIISGRDLSQDVMARWRDIQQANSDLTSPYFCPEFTSSVALVRDDVEIAMLEEGGRTVAFFPYQRSARGVGVPVGGVLSDYQGIIGASNLHLDPIALLRACRLRAWDFDHLLTSQPLFRLFYRHYELSPQMDLSRGYDAYVADRQGEGTDQINRCTKLARRIERDLGPLRFVDHESGGTELAQVLSWKSRQYLASGKPDLLAWSWTRRLLETIHDVRSDTFVGLLSLLYAGDRLVAGHFGMRSQTTWHYWLPAYDLQAAKYSPGLLLLLKMAEHASSLGVRVIDLGKGASFYKSRLMNASVTLASGSVERALPLRVARESSRRLRQFANSVPFASAVKSWWRSADN